MGRGVVSLLDEEHSNLVEDLWIELESELDLRGLSDRIIPHLSYHVADAYEQQSLQRALKEFASGQRELRIKTVGLGIFSGSAPALYLAVERSPGLSRFHEELCTEISHTARNESQLYRPDGWVPHITLASWTYMEPDLRNRLSEVMILLVHRPFNWEIVLNNLSILRSSDETGGKQELVFTVGLRSDPDKL